MQKRSLHLNDRWDIHLNAAGNFVDTTGLYCDAQNVANAVRMFTNDAYLAQRDGVPHFTVDLGVKPALSEVRAAYRTAARNVENIRDAEVTIYGVDSETRELAGMIASTVESGERITAEF